MSRPVERPKGGLWKTEIVRAVLSGHSILGIAFAAIIFLVCLTGTLCVFLRDMQRWEQPSAPVVTTVSDGAAARAIAAAGAKAGPGATLFVNMPGADMPRLLISSDDDHGDKSWIADADGHLAAEQQDPWVEFLADLHTELHLPRSWGRFVVGMAGVALLSSLISGILAHPRVFRDAFHLRLGGSRRLQEADLHNRLGVWPLPFHIIVSLTGALLGLSTIIVGVLALLLFRGDSEKVYDLLSPPRPKADARPAPMPDIAALIAAARRMAPLASPRLVTVHGWGQRDMTVDIASGRSTMLAAQDGVTFDVHGRAIAVQRPDNQNVGQRILGSLGPLHFGWFGGIAVRIAYGLLGLALCTVTSSGIRVWLARRRDKGRPAPAWERLWSAVAWGQPAAIAATLLATVLMPSLAAGRLTALWLIASLLILLGAGAGRWSASALDRLFVGVTGLLLSIAAVTWAVSAAGDDGGAVAVNAAIGLIGLILLARVVVPRLRAARPGA